MKTNFDDYEQKDIHNSYGYQEFNESRHYRAGIPLWKGALFLIIFAVIAYLLN